MPKLSSLKREARRFYKSIISLYCPILKETVYFTAQGFDHLINKPNSRAHRSYPRKPTEQYMKLMCLEHAPAVIANCSLVTQIRSSTRIIKGRKKQVLQYELTHKVRQDVEIRVIVEQVGQGKHKFVSIMPHNKKSKKTSTKKRP